MVLLEYIMGHRGVCVNMVIDSLSSPDWVIYIPHCCPPSLHRFITLPPAAAQRITDHLSGALSLVQVVKILEPYAGAKVCAITTHLMLKACKRHFMA